MQGIKSSISLVSLGHQLLLLLFLCFYFYWTFFWIGNKSFIDRKSTMCLQWKTHCTWNKYNQIKWKIYNSLAVTTYKRSWSIISPQIISMQHLSSIIFSVFSHYQLLKSCSQAIANPKNVTSLGNLAPQKFPQGNLTTKSPLRPS